MKKKKIAIITSIALIVLIIVIGFGMSNPKLDKINKVPDTVDVIPPDQEDFEIDTSNGAERYHRTQTGRGRLE
jgi:hypothetical protein